MRSVAEKSADAAGMSGIGRAGLGGAGVVQPAPVTEQMEVSPRGWRGAWTNTFCR